MLVYQRVSTVHLIGVINQQNKKRRTSTKYKKGEQVSVVNHLQLSHSAIRNQLVMQTMPRTQNELHIGFTSTKLISSWIQCFILRPSEIHRISEHIA